MPSVLPTCPDDFRTTWGILPLPMECPWTSEQVARTEEPIWLVWMFLCDNLEVSGRWEEASLVHREAQGPYCWQEGQRAVPAARRPPQALPTVSLAFAPQAPEESPVHCGPCAGQLGGALQHPTGAVRGISAQSLRQGHPGHPCGTPPGEGIGSARGPGHLLPWLLVAT